MSEDIRSFTAEELKNIELMASQAISKRLIAINLQIQPFVFEDLLLDSNNPVARAYYSGHIKLTGILNRGMIKAAGNGSNPMLLELLKKIAEDV